jgi:hypothetical protein
MNVVCLWKGRDEGRIGEGTGILIVNFKIFWTIFPLRIFQSMTSLATFSVTMIVKNQKR